MIFNYHSIIFFVGLLFVCQIQAIPASQLDHSDPELILKLLNGSIVVDNPNLHLRQPTPTIIANFWQDANLQNGYAYPYGNQPLQIGSWVPQYYDLSSDPNAQYGSYFYNEISSLQLLDPGYMIAVYDQINYGGNVRVFRSLQPINNLGDQGNFNDKIKSIKAIYMGPMVQAANLWEGTNYSKKVAYVGVGIYNDMAAATYIPYLGIGDNTLSSIEIFGYTKVKLCTNTNLSGTCTGNIPALTQPGTLSIPNIGSYGGGISDNSCSSLTVSQAF